MPAATTKPTAATNSTKLDRIAAILNDFGLDLGDLGRAVAPAATQPKPAATAAKDNTPLFLIGGGVLLLFLFMKRGAF